MFDIDTTTDIFKGFIMFIEERALIYHKKEVLKQSSPWTNDAILANGKFGNVWRELDRGTKWEIEQLQMLIDNDVELILTYRHNLIPWVTHSLINEGYSYARSKMMGNLKPVISNVIKIYPLYKCTHSIDCMDNLYGSCVIQYVIDHYKDVRKNKKDFVQYLCTSNNIYDIHKAIQYFFPRLGEFKAYEVLTSLTYCNWYASSENDYPYIGHGAVSMIRKLTGDYQCPDNVLSLYLPNLRDAVVIELGERKNMIWSIDKFTIRTLEDCACEYRKYCEVRDGTRINRQYPDTLGRWS